MIVFAKNIITMDAGRRIIRDGYIRITDGVISSVGERSSLGDTGNEQILDASGLTLLPGFIQPHIHLCQTLFRGIADNLELLDWLQLRIFPYENAHSKSSLRVSARLGINELLKGGTTTILDMGTLRHQEVIFEELTASGMRAFAGKCMMDENTLYPAFRNDTRAEMEETYSLAKEFHFKNPRIGYGFAPRFALSCSNALLKETAELQKDFPESILHTHASENKSEIEEVRRRYGKENIDYLDSTGMLTGKSVLAHCIHLNDNEIKTLKERNSAVCHCPSSNLKLSSGIANIPRYLKEGIKVSIGADGAPCNNNLSALIEGRLAALIQKPLHGPLSMDAFTVLKLMTIDGAAALGIDGVTGSIETGKKADFILINLNTYNKSVYDSDESIYSGLIYSGGDADVEFTFVDGNCVYQKDVKEVYDQAELLSEAKMELKSLLNRV